MTKIVHFSVVFSILVQLLYLLDGFDQLPNDTSFPVALSIVQLLDQIVLEVSFSAYGLKRNVKTGSLQRLLCYDFLKMS